MTTPVRRSGGLAALVIALLVAACGPSTATQSPSSAVSPTPAPAETTPVDGSSPPASPAPSPAALACDPDAPLSSGEPSPAAADPDAALYEAIEGQVIELRGLTPTSTVERGVFDRTSLCQYIAASFREDNPQELIVGTENLYKALLLMPEGESLEDLYVELLTSQVAGLYNDETKRMYVVVTDSGEIGPAEQITYAHEYTHALQDQQFNLRDFVGEATDQGDRTIARSTVVEGDATLLMSLWAQQHLTPQELGEIGSSVDPASEAILQRMPAILRDGLLFPYTGGLQLALVAFQQGGGFAGVDALYADPPDTTEQVLHPAKLEADEQAVPVAFPADLATRLGEGWAVGIEDTLGEFQLEIFLRDAADADGSDDAAEGWGGDRVAFLEGPDGAGAAVLDTAWDTDADAAEFAAALGQYVAKLEAAGRAGAVLTPAPDRVVVISATDADSLSTVANALGLAG